MKFFVSLVGMLCMACTMTLAQTVIVAEPITLSTADQNVLNAGIGEGNYKTYSINTNALVDHAVNKSEVIEFTLSIGTESYEIIAERNPEFMGKEMVPMVMDEEGNPVALENLVFESYQGYVKGSPDLKARVAISEVGVSFNIYHPDGPIKVVPTYMPLRQSTFNNEYIYFRSPNSWGPEGCDLRDDGPVVEPGCSYVRNSYEVTQMSGPCRRMVEIAVEGDVEFMNRFPNNFWGNIIAAITMLFTVESGEAVYVNEFSMGFQVTSFRMWRNQATSPYRVTNLLIAANRADLVEDLRDEFAGIPQANIRRDVPVLFTGNVCTNGAATSWGRVHQLASACTIEAAMFLTDCVFNDGNWDLTMAHEIGHEFDAVHSENGTCSGDCGLGAGQNSLMCAGSCPAGDVLFIDNPNQSRINNYLINNGDCTNNDSRIDGPALLCSGNNATYDFIVTNTAVPNLTWTVSSGLVINWQTATEINVSPAPGASGTQWVRANVNDAGFNGGCDPQFTRHIQVDYAPRLCTNGYYRICPTNFIGIRIGVPNGVTVNNFQCTSNCGGITPFVGGTNPMYFWANFTTPGNYSFSYDVTTACGTTTYPFHIRVLTPSECDDDPLKTNPQDGNIVQMTPEVLDLEIFPNPTTGEFALSYFLSESTPTELSIYDLKGQKVYEEISAQDQTPGLYQKELDLTKLPNGIYMVTLSTDRGKETVRLSIQH